MSGWYDILQLQRNKDESIDAQFAATFESDPSFPVRALSTLFPLPRGETRNWGPKNSKHFVQRP